MRVPSGTAARWAGGAPGRRSRCSLVLWRLAVSAPSPRLPRAGPAAPPCRHGQQVAPRWVGRAAVECGLGSGRSRRSLVLWSLALAAPSPRLSCAGASCQGQQALALLRPWGCSLPLGRGTARRPGTWAVSASRLAVHTAPGTAMPPPCRCLAPGGRTLAGRAADHGARCVERGAQAGVPFVGRAADDGQPGPAAHQLVQRSGDQLAQRSVAAVHCDVQRRMCARPAAGLRRGLAQDRCFAMLAAALLASRVLQRGARGQPPPSTAGLGRFGDGLRCSVDA